MLHSARIAAVAVALFACSSSTTNITNNTTRADGGDDTASSEASAPHDAAPPATDDAGVDAEADAAPVCAATTSTAPAERDCMPTGACAMTGCSSMTSYQCTSDLGARRGVPKGLTDCVVDTAGAREGYEPVCCKPACVEALSTTCSTGRGVSCAFGIAPTGFGTCEQKIASGGSVTYCCVP